MEGLVTKSDMLGQKIDSSLEMTKDIDQQVTEVAQLIEVIVSLGEKSASHAGSSSKELKNAVEATKTMANLSADVEKILQDFKNQFERVKHNGVSYYQLMTNGNM